MSGDQRKHAVISFGPFAADLHTQELRKQGVRLRLPGQSFQILKMLLEGPGELVTREELHKALWPSETFVDFEHGVNAAVNRLREVLGDSADSPCLIETLPRRGYRFIGTVTQAQVGPIASSETGAPPQLFPSSESNVGIKSRKGWLRIAVPILVGVACLLAALFAYRGSHPRAELATLTAVPFSALPGEESGPTFSPDGSHMVFTWDGGAAPGTGGRDLYIKALGSETLLRLTQHPSRCLDAAWSPDGTQIAFHRVSGPDTGVYVVPALGGPERKLQSTHIPYCFSAISWSPDGKSIAFVDSQPLVLHGA